MAFHYSSRSIVLAIVLCFKTLYASSDDECRVYLTSDSPTTLGSTTTFYARIVHYGRGQAFRFTFTYFNGSIVKEVYNSHECNITISTWISSGKYKVTVFAERMKPFRDCGKDLTHVTVTDTITAYLKTSPSQELYVGPVMLSVLVHDPSQFFDKIVYYWDFNDGTYMNNTKLSQLSHNFTQIKTYYVKVTVFSMTKGILYNGTARKELTFDAKFDPSLTVINSNNISTLRLPSEDTKTMYVELGRQLQLIVKYNNPYGIVQKCTAQWSIGHGQPTCIIEYTFTDPGQKDIYVITTFETTKKNVTSDPIPKKLFVQAPITGLSLGNKNQTSFNRYLKANISCQGSAPFMMCWQLSKYSNSQLGNPLVKNCTGLSTTCRFYINRTITYKGTLQLDVTVINRVGSDHLLKHFAIPEDVVPHHHRAKTEAVSAVVPIVICIFIAIILIYIVRKVYTIRHRSVLETANFDFRDEDCQSVESFNMGRKCCPSFKFWRRNKESYPLLERWNRQSTSSSLYSDIL